MSSVFFVIGFLVGVAMAVAVTMLIMISLIKSSNDWGDYDGSFQFVEHFEVTNKANGVKSTFSPAEGD